jgi:uncharacterized protein YdaU (DUF1376 family)
MLDLYYYTEKPLPRDRKKLYALVRADTPQQKGAVESVLKKYWRGSGGRLSGYVQWRASKEIAKLKQYRANCVRAGKLSGLARNARSTGVEQSLNTPYSVHHTPNAERSDLSLSQAHSLGIPLSLWAQYKKLRESLHRPILPGSEEHIIAELRELKKAGEDPSEVLTRAIRTSSWKFSPKNSHQKGDHNNERQRRTKAALESVLQEADHNLPE